MTVYLDIVFVENVLMNYIILFACGLLLKVKLKNWRMLISSVIGATYTIIMYLNIVPIYSNFLMKFVLSVAMVYVAYCPKNIKQVTKHIIFFYLTSFIFGGCVFGLMYFIKPQLVQIRNGVFVGTYPMKVAIAGGGIAFIIIQISFRLVKTKLSKKDMIHRIRINICGKSCSINALLDTGNMLKEPLTGNPVIIVEKVKLKNILPEEILENSEKILGGDTDDINIKYVSRFRMIPFSSVGKQNGLLLGIKSDSVDIEIDNEFEIRKNVIVGIYNKSFTKNGLYSAIIGMDIIERSIVNENVSNVEIQYK